MAVRNLPGLDLRGGWTEGDGGWGNDMNANLLKLSTVTQLVVISRTTAIASALTNQGDITIVPSTAPQANRVAVLDETVYKYYTPRIGWEAYVLDESRRYRYMGSTDGWVPVPAAYDPQTKASMTARVISGEVDIAANPGTNIVTAIALPTYSTAIACGIEVITDIVGPAEFDVGVVGNLTLFRTAMPITSGSRDFGQIYSPVTFDFGGPVPVRLSAASDMTDGRVRLTLYCWEMVWP